MILKAYDVIYVSELYSETFLGHESIRIKEDRDPDDCGTTIFFHYVHFK